MAWERAQEGAAKWGHSWRKKQHREIPEGEGGTLVWDTKSSSVCLEQRESLEEKREVIHESKSVRALS